VAVELPTGPSGARRRLRRGGYRTRAEAQRALAGLRQPHLGNPYRVLLSTGQWLVHWLATRLRPRPATLRSYHQHIDQHLIPHLGGIVLRELCLDDVQSAFAVLARTPTRYGRARAASTLHRIRATLRVALNAALRRGLIEANPARYLELPPASRPRAVVWTQARVAHWRATGEHPTVAVWTAHQTAQFLHHIGQHRLYPLSPWSGCGAARPVPYAGATWTCTTGRCWSAGNSSSTVASYLSVTPRPPAAFA
jgi:hypothetical protein